MRNGNIRNRDMILLQQKSLYFSERISIFKVQYQSQRNEEMICEESRNLLACSMQQQTLRMIFSLIKW